MKGYMTILAALALLVVTGGIATALMFSSIDASSSQEALRKGDQALLFSESCAEEGLLQIAKNQNYGGGNFDFPQGSCEVAVENNSGTYIVSATGKNDYFEKKLVAEAVLDADKLRVTNWKEE